MGSGREETEDEDTEKNRRLLRESSAFDGAGDEKKDETARPGSAGMIRLERRMQPVHRIPVQIRPACCQDICFWKIELVIRIVLSICSCSSFVFPSFRI